jgi:hypothetical protein
VVLYLADAEVDSQGKFFFLWEKKQSAQNPNFSTWRMPMSDQVAKLETAAGSFFLFKKKTFLTRTGRFTRKIPSLCTF